MLVKIKVGQIWTDGFSRFQITRIGSDRQPYAKDLDESCDEVRFAYILNDNDQHDMPPPWHLESVEKKIPDFPLDTTLPILQAGYLQDRQRKQFKHIKGKENV